MMKGKKGGGRGGYNHGPPLAPQPTKFMDAVAKMREKFEGKDIVAYVGYGFGLGEGRAAVSASPAADGTPTKGQWQIYVQSDDGSLVVEPEFMGFPVCKRSIAVAGLRAPQRK